MENSAGRLFCAKRSHRCHPSARGELARFWTARHGDAAASRLVDGLPACGAIGFARGGEFSCINLGLEVPGLARLLDFRNDAFQAGNPLYPDYALVWRARLFLVAKRDCPRKESRAEPPPGSCWSVELLSLSRPCTRGRILRKAPPAEPGGRSRLDNGDGLESSIFLLILPADRAALSQTCPENPGQRCLQRFGLQKSCRGNFSGIESFAEGSRRTVRHPV